MTNGVVGVKIIKPHFLKLSLFMCGIFIVMEGCGSSAFVATWKAPSFKSPPLTTMLVIAVRKDSARRRMWEDGFVVELAKHGVTGTPSYRLFPDTSPDTAQVDECIRIHGFAGLLISRRVPRVRNTQDASGDVPSEPVIRYDPWKERYFALYHHEGQQSTSTDGDTVARHTIEVWATKDSGILIWRATTETTDPNAVHAYDVVNAVVPELAQQAIIPPEQ